VLHLYIELRKKSQTFNWNFRWYTSNAAVDETWMYSI